METFVRDTRGYLAQFFEGSDWTEKQISVDPTPSSNLAQVRVLIKIMIIYIYRVLCAWGCAEHRECHLAWMWTLP